MILRPYYLNKIKPFLGKGIVKAVTGMRRSGKSVFVRQLMEELKLDGIPDKNILYVDKESLDFNFIMDFRDLGERFIYSLTRYRILTNGNARSRRGRENRINTIS